MKLAQCPACMRRISINATQCSKCGEPLNEGWAEKSLVAEKKSTRRILFWLIVIPFSIAFLPWACSKIETGINKTTNSNSTYSPSVNRTYSGDGYRNGTLYKDGDPIKNGYQSNLEKNQKSTSYNTDLPRSCWAAGEPISASCQGEVSTDLFPFCPSKELYEQVKDMMPSRTALVGCETDVEGRMVKVLSCSYTTCKYSLYYGYDNWKTMWSQAGIVEK